MHADHWAAAAKPAGFFYLKSAVCAILERLGLDRCREVPFRDERFSEGLKLMDNDRVLVELGVVHPDFTKPFEIRQEVVYANLKWSDLIEMAHSKTALRFAELPKFPEVRRDFALLLGTERSFSEIYELAYRTERNLLKEVQLFDVYTGDKLPEGKKSYAVSFTLQDAAKTLTDKKIDGVMDRLRKTFEAELGAELR